jgi:RNA polymerase sigma-70 factor (ECF subfamily)
VAEITVPDHVPELEENEYRSYLVSRALSLMQADFKPQTWRAAWEHAVQDRPAAEVAAELGLTPAAVSCAKFRVMNRLRQELQGFLD